jgi:hypothetical protein
MKGYYTVRVTASSLQPAERVALEIQYARALEEALGGAERTIALCLAAAVQGPEGPAQAGLCSASETAASSLRAVTSVPDDCRFSINAWRAQDL